MSTKNKIEHGYQIKHLTFCKYVLTTPNKTISLSFPQMLDLRRKINQLTSCASLEKIINNENFVLLFVADKQHLIYLEISQLLKLKEQISTFFKANSSVLV